MMIPVEPSADMRQLTNLLRQMYVGLVEQGFTEDQAFELTQTWLAAMVEAGGNE